MIAVNLYKKFTLFFASVYNKFISHVEWDHPEEMRVYTSILDVKKSAWLIFKYAYKRNSGLMRKLLDVCIYYRKKYMILIYYDINILFIYY